MGPLIHAVQQETQAAGVAIEQGTQRMEAGYQVSRQASERLQEIAAISRESAALAQDISVATQDQVRGTEGVANAVKSIAGFAVKTDAFREASALQRTRWRGSAAPDSPARSRPPRLLLAASSRE